MTSREHRDRRSAGGRMPSGSCSRAAPLARPDEGPIAAALLVRGATRSAVVQGGCSDARMPWDGRRAAARGSTGRHGFALVEALVVGTVGLLVVQAAWSVAAAQSAVASRVVAGAEELDQTRLIRHLLSVEVAGAAGQGDRSIVGGELHLRAFRGAAFACSEQPAAGWAVATDGYRSPNRDKDSVLVLSADGRWRASALRHRSSAGSRYCQPLEGFVTEVWSLDPPRPAALAGIYFERGGYRFSGSALRYLAGSRWQPLTSTRIRTGSSTIAASTGGAVETSVAWDGRGFDRSASSWKSWSRR